MGRMLARATSEASDQGEQAPKVPTSPDAWRATAEGRDQPRRLGCTILTVQCDYSSSAKNADQLNQK